MYIVAQLARHSGSSDGMILPDSLRDFSLMPDRNGYTIVSDRDVGDLRLPESAELIRGFQAAIRGLAEEHGYSSSLVLRMRRPQTRHDPYQRDPYRREKQLLDRGLSDGQVTQHEYQERIMQLRILNGMPFRA